MRSPRFPICLLILLLSCQAVLAGGGKPAVSGIVTDSYGHPLAGVLVSVKGQKTATVSGEDGAFHIDAGPGSTLTFQHPRFDFTQVRVGAANVVVRLNERFLTTQQSPGRAAEKADTVELPASASGKIDVLYGQTSSESFLGSISTIGAHEVGETPAPSILYALPGRLAGLDVNQTAGFSSFSTSALTSQNIFLGTFVPNNNSGAGPTDNSEFNVTLRGHGESMGQNPIAIVDGVQRELYSIDPRTIESISILKDPLSNLFLGQNSSRGALIITTRQPQSGPTHLDITAESGAQTSLGLPVPLPAYQYAYLLNEALLNDGKPVAYTQADFNAYRNHTDPYGHPDVNWYNTIIRKNPLLSRINLNASGGSNVARYVINVSYMDQQGMFVTSPANPYNTNLDLQRYIIDSKIDVNVNKNFEVRLQLFGRLQDGNQPGGSNGNASPAAGGGVPSILAGLLSTPNNAYPVYNPDGSFGGNQYYTQNLMAEVVGSGYEQSHLHDVLTNLDLKYKLDQVTKGLWVEGSGNVSVESQTLINRSLQTQVYQMKGTAGVDTTYLGFGKSVAQSNLYSQTAWARYRYFRLAAGYDRTFGDNGISAEIMADQKRTLLNYDLPSQLTNFNGKVAYNYKQKYFVEGAASVSGYNRYAPGHQYGFFYAGGLGWDVTKEPFFQRLFPWVDHFKMRATYGLTGNANVDYYGYYIWREHYQNVAGTYAIGSSYSSGQVNAWAEDGTNNSQVLPNSNATWEKADKFDGGVDLSFLHNTLLFTGDYYHERYFDVMQQRGDNIALIGISYPNENIGKDLYQGAEVSLTYQNHVGNVNYFATGNASVQQTKVLYMQEQYEQNAWNVRTGRPVGQLFGYIVNGLYQTGQAAATGPSIPGYTPKAGDLRYADLNGDGIINQFDEAPLGKGRPLIYYGLTLGFSVLGIECSALFQGVTNREEYEANPYIYEGFIAQNNQYSQAYQQVLGRWIPENAAVATSPRLTAGGNNYNYSPNNVYSSYFLHNGDFWRLKTLSVGYNLPYRVLRRAKIGGIKIFGSAQNLFTHEAFKGIDPEVSLPNYPLQRVLNLGINLKF
ncbi:SusC/RagA family TonB-linked outer membrane protein [Dinghuibacter silviterrae]|uniref:TonB-linked SusC/RagA family outer membrane protein n=1 Tax=Dinghuibacter silviterrae TaxID=1539049 RepID=A0A4R8DFE6_9BACT|nr:SusC/RagA family TonB-linked outer membrane protein [Dinghuibacter silviterrae]TDW96323.1 TonB-linked SusC/RagA family outer membrane protein [Dinghuibacter silviterrae]